MAVDMKRSTNMAPVSLSTSYLMGSAFIGISMMTLTSSGTLRPAVTRSRFTRPSLGALGLGQSAQQRGDLALGPRRHGLGRGRLGRRCRRRGFVGPAEDGIGRVLTAASGMALGGAPFRGVSFQIARQP